jgi:CheY-like chemotaxis protein
LEDIKEEAERAGADAFLRKPNNLIELVETIRRLLAE